MKQGDMVRQLNKHPLIFINLIMWILQTLNPCVVICGLLGALSLSITLIKALIFFINLFSANNLIKKYGRNSWVIVTGGSDGIGLGFCEELALAGFNICMIARNKSKMQQALEKIKKSSKQSVQTVCIVANFVNCNSPEFFDHIIAELQSNGILQKVSILVNNVGMCNSDYFEQISPKKLIDEVNVNCISMTMLSKKIIPYMLNRQQRSAIINLSSYSAQHPNPYFSHYSATKSFNDAFSKSISIEYQKEIDILTVRPLFVESQMSKQKLSWQVISRNQCARGSLGSLGKLYQTNGYWIHSLLSYIIGCFPEWAVGKISRIYSQKIMIEQKKAK